MIRAHELLQFRNFLGGEIIITFGMAILRVLPWNTADIRRREEIWRWGSQCTRRGRAGEGLSSNSIRAKDNFSITWELQSKI